MAEKQVVGGRGKRRDPNVTPVVTNWQTDIVDNKDPDFAYQFFREDEVPMKLRPSRLVLGGYPGSDVPGELHEIPPWQVCHRDLGPEKAAGFRPDEGKELDTVVRHGNYVLMKLPKQAHEVIERAQEQRADAYDVHQRRTKADTVEQWTETGRIRRWETLEVARTDRME